MNLSDPRWANRPKTLPNYCPNLANPPNHAPARQGIDALTGLARQKFRGHRCPHRRGPRTFRGHRCPHRRAQRHFEGIDALTGGAAGFRGHRCPHRRGRPTFRGHRCPRTFLSFWVDFAAASPLHTKQHIPEHAANKPNSFAYMSC